MNQEEHTKIIQGIRASMPEGADLSQVTDKLTALADDYGKTLAELEDAKKSASQLKQENENLRDTNMRLFLKVGEPGTGKEPKEPEPPTLKFEDLFNEKGTLK